MHRAILLFFVSLASASPIQAASTLSPLETLSLLEELTGTDPSAPWIRYVRPTEDVVEWVALGDSFTAGTGSNGSPEVIEKQAWRGARAYPLQMQGDAANWQSINSNSHRVPDRFTFGAFTGATSIDVSQWQLRVGPFDPNSAKVAHPTLGKPQLAVMTIGGNDAYLKKIINDCMYRFIGAKDCQSTLRTLQNDITSGELKAKVFQAIHDVLEFGVAQGGANPPKSFQVYIPEYVPFFDETTTNCDDLSMGYFRIDRPKLTQALRARMNDLVNQVNGVIKEVVTENVRGGVFFVEGIADQYRAGDHQFCGRNHDKYRVMIDKNTWFWSWYAPPPDTTSEGPDRDNNSPAPVATIDSVQTVLDFMHGPGAFTPESYTEDQFQQDEAKYQTFDNLLTAMAQSDDVKAQEWTLTSYRSFHPKGTALAVHAEAIMNAIKRNRGPVQSSSDEPPAAPAAPAPLAADTCGTWYSFFFDHFEIYGKNFDPKGEDTWSADGSDLKHEISGCGVITEWKFEHITGDPNGYTWKATGNLPIGEKSCVGNAVLTAGGTGATKDGCNGSG